MGAGGLISFLLFMPGARDWLYLWLALLLLSYPVSALVYRSTRSVPYIPNQLMQQLQGLGKVLGLWLTLLWIFGLNTSRRWRVITGVVIAVSLTVNPIDYSTIWSWQTAGPGIVRTSFVTTEIYTGLSFFPIFLVGFGLARKKISSLVPLGVIAATFGAWAPALNVAGSCWQAVEDRMARWGLTIATYHFSAFALLGWRLILTMAVTVVRR